MSLASLSHNRAISSHLQTHGCTVVIGEDVEQINRVIQCFLKTYDSLKLLSSLLTHCLSS